ncbi:PREDICTED: uncharacterized protein LOC106815723 [Priapulus caudatus]|uniref:Uncharacterized protein LOC106815723 n=1 Tax=Priapulus caudatus TaxID=37621 RepID=A0ABM1EU40_PRICU|nr:PREDICTED: uncharacterized protein LOC106815723 [Priapulus caudatus]
MLFAYCGIFGVDATQWISDVTIPMSATSEFTGEVAEANQGSNCPASVHCIKNAMDNNPMTKWIANSSANEEIAFDVLTPIYLDAICIKYSEGRIGNISISVKTQQMHSWIYVTPLLLLNSTGYSVRYLIANLELPYEFRYFKISILDTYAAEMNIGISDIYFRIKGECTDMCNVNAYCDTGGATPTCVCRDGWLGDGIYCYHGPLASAMLNRYGCRLTIILGGLLSPTGDIFVNFFLGLGFGLSYTPCVIMVGRYFNKWLYLATAVACTGEGLGLVLFPIIFEKLIEEYHYDAV